jgi:hypothetical protein
MVGGGQLSKDAATAADAMVEEAQLPTGHYAQCRSQMTASLVAAHRAARATVSEAAAAAVGRSLAV